MTCRRRFEKIRAGPEVLEKQNLELEYNVREKMALAAVGFARIKTLSQ